MLKRILFILLLSFVCFGAAFGQQITRFAVVDLPRVYQAFFRESRAVREFEERTQRFQSDLDRRTTELQDLRVRHSEAVLSDNEVEALRLENLIHRRTEALVEFYQSRTAQLERERDRLMQSSSFLNQVHDELRFIAESEGFSMVLNIRNNPSIIWFSPSVDITDRLIQNLQARVR